MQNIVFIARHGTVFLSRDIRTVEPIYNYLTTPAMVTETIPVKENMLFQEDDTRRVSEVQVAKVGSVFGFPMMR